MHVLVAQSNVTLCNARLAPQSYPSAACTMVVIAVPGTAQHPQTCLIDQEVLSLVLAAPRMQCRNACEDMLPCYAHRRSITSGCTRQRMIAASTLSCTRLRLWYISHQIDVLPSAVLRQRHSYRQIKAHTTCFRPLQPQAPLSNNDLVYCVQERQLHDPDSSPVSSLTQFHTASTPL